MVRRRIIAINVEKKGLEPNKPHKLNKGSLRAQNKVEDAKKAVEKTVEAKPVAETTAKPVETKALKIEIPAEKSEPNQKLVKKEAVKKPAPKVSKSKTKKVGFGKTKKPKSDLPDAH